MTTTRDIHDLTHGTGEAQIDSTTIGKVPRGDGWFVLNLAESRWVHNERSGEGCAFEGDVPFVDFGINVHVLHPGQPGCVYHRENRQEAFVVLEGEALLIVEGQERRVCQWDFIHCPAGTAHVFVNDGAAPCVVLMVGSRSPGGAGAVYYPANDVAARYGASSSTDTSDGIVAYEGFPEWDFGPPRWPLDRSGA